MKSVNLLCAMIERNSTNTSESQRGNMVYRWHESSERYIVDFADDFKAEGWEQFDTDQDAAYFGVWVNRTTFTTLSYCEGDWIVAKCHDAQHYNAEIEDMFRYYGEGYICKAYDKDGCTIYRQDRSKFLIPV